MDRNAMPTVVRHGFTMIEMVVVMAILAIAAAIVVPMMSSAGAMQVRAAVNMVAADLEYAKSMSVSRGQRYSVVFDKTNETYRIIDDSGTTIPHPIKKGFLYTINFRADSRLSQVDIFDANFDGTDRVSFDYMGSPFNGTGTPLNSGVVTLRAGGVTRTINVEPVTGYVSISN